ncbi:MAG: polyprenyl synthetase family protein [Anaerolineae bacterium]
MNDAGQQIVLEKELEKRREKIYNYLLSQEYVERFSPPHLREAVYSYIRQGGKSLRPALLLFSCGAVGGDEDKAIPAAAAIEVYHTWTLVHDDIIDRDNKRRGALTVHEEWRRKALELDYQNEEAYHYGLSVAILAGDVQHSWAISLLCELYIRYGISPSLVVRLIENLETYVMTALAEGEALDIQFCQSPVESLSEKEIIKMLWGKTGALYEFAARAGAMIGLETEELRHPLVEAIAKFATNCGIAFQLQDDILGVIGNEKLLGKPVGSDLREGKRTIIIHHVFQRADQAQKNKLLKVLGNRFATPEEVHEVTELLKALGGVEYTRDLARALIRQAMEYLQPLPASEYKELLLGWANYMIEREF